MTKKQKLMKASINQKNLEKEALEIMQKLSFFEVKKNQYAEFVNGFKRHQQKILSAPIPEEKKKQFLENCICVSYFGHFAFGIGTNTDEDGKLARKYIQADKGAFWLQNV